MKMATSAGDSHISSSTSEKKPKRSILKHTHDHRGHKGGASFDEMNILATYHPIGKDYGHMKIDEPKTPYRCDDNDIEVLDPDDVSKRLADINQLQAERKHHDSGSDRLEQDVDFEEHLSPEEQERHKQFQLHRKEHYNMKEQIKRAKELLEKEMAELDDE